MAHIIIKPTNQADPNYQSELDTYNMQIDSIRKLASPDLVSRLTEEELPEADIADDVYLAAKERQVLKDAGIDAADVASLTAERRAQLVYMTQLLEAIEIAPQIPQIVRQRALHTSTDYQEIDWEKHIEKLANNYKIELLVFNPSGSTSLITPIQVFTTNTMRE